MCCPFNRKKFNIGDVIETVVGEDGCTNSTLTCVEKGNRANIDITVKNDCDCGNFRCTKESYSSELY